MSRNIRLSLFLAAAVFGVSWGATHVGKSAVAYFLYAAVFLIVALLTFWEQDKQSTRYGAFAILGMVFAVAGTVALYAF